MRDEMRSFTDSHQTTMTLSHRAISGASGSDLHHISQHVDHILRSETPSPRALVAPTEAVRLSFQDAGHRIVCALRGVAPEKSLFEELLFRQTLRMLHCAEYAELGIDREAHSGTDSDVGSCSDETFPPPLMRQTSSVFRDYRGRNAPPATLLSEWLALLRKGELPSKEHALMIVASAAWHLNGLPNVVQCDVPIGGKLVVVGDIHGQLQDLNCILDARGHPYSESDSRGHPCSPTSYLFNGDFVDRGPNSVEVLLCLFCLMLLYPDAVHLNRGNHECSQLNARYGFRMESTVKYGDDFFDCVQEAFCRLPLVYIVGNQIAVIHGGLPAEPAGLTLQDINMLDRQMPLRLGAPNLSKEEKIHQALLWSDPKDLIDGSEWKESIRGAGVYFGAGLTDAFLKANGLKRIIRSHEVFTPGYAMHHKGNTTTVFSASNYAGEDDNHGCHLLVHPSMEVEFCTHSVLGRLDTDDLRKRFAKRSGSGFTRKQECLKVLWRAIFHRRQSLLHRFQMDDVAGDGKVTVEQWVQACRSCVYDELPWYALSHYLAQRDHTDGRIAYIPFLERFQNRLVRRWMRKWAARLLPFVIERLLQCCDQKNRRLSFYDLCTALREEFPGLRERGVYYLLVVLCPGGCANVAALEALAGKPVTDPPCAVDLWVMCEFRTHDWRTFSEDWRDAGLQLHRRKHPRSSGEGGIHPVDKETFVSLCLRSCGQVGQTARHRWMETAHMLDIRGSGLIEWKDATALVRELDSYWRRASQVLDILATAAIARVGLLDMFSAASPNPNGKFCKADFAKATEQFVGRRMGHFEATLLFNILDGNGDGFVSLSDVTEALDVADTWDVGHEDARHEDAQHAENGSYADQNIFEGMSSVCASLC